MAYVGRGLNQTGGQYRKLDDISSGFDGDATGFSLTVDNLEVTPTAQNLMISINGVIQDPGTAFTVVGSTITFTGAPASSSDFFGVVMGEASYIAYGTVGANEMGVSEGAVSASGGVVVDSSKNIQGINQVTATQFVGGGSGITGVTAEWDGTHTGDGTITGNFNVTGNITGSNLEPIYRNDRPKEVKEAMCSADKARKILNYKTSTSLVTGIEKTFEYIKNRGAREFDYTKLNLEIKNSLTPRVWLDKEIWYLFVNFES